MPMLDPLATFLMRVQDAGNDIEPVAALFGGRADTTAAQRELAEQLARRAYDQGLIEDTGTPGAGDGPARVAVTAAGAEFLADSGL